MFLMGGCRIRKGELAISLSSRRWCGADSRLLHKTYNTSNGLGLESVQGLGSMVPGFAPWNADTLGLLS